MQNLGDKQRVLWYFPKWPIHQAVDKPANNLSLSIGRSSMLTFNRCDM